MGGGGGGGGGGGVLQQRNFWSEVRAFFMLGSFICEDKVIFIHIFLLLFFFFLTTVGSFWSHTSIVVILTKVIYSV